MDMERITAAFAALFDDLARLNHMAAFMVLDSQADSELDEVATSLCRALEDLGRHIRELDALLGIDKHCLRRDLANLLNVAERTWRTRPEGEGDS